MLSLAALHAERSSALIFLVSRSTQRIIYYAKRYSGWQYWVHHCISLYCCKVFFWFIFFSSPPPQSISDILFQKNVSVFLAQRRGSCYSLFLLILCILHPHIEILIPPCSHTCLCASLPFCCVVDPVRSFGAEKQPAWCRLFHSILVEWFNKLTLDGTWFFLIF